MTSMDELIKDYYPAGAEKSLELTSNVYRPPLYLSPNDRTREVIKEAIRYILAARWVCFIGGMEYRGNRVRIPEDVRDLTHHNIFSEFDEDGNRVSVEISKDYYRYQDSKYEPLSFSFEDIKPSLMMMARASFPAIKVDGVEPRTKQRAKFRYRGVGFVRETYAHNLPNWYTVTGLAVATMLPNIEGKRQVAFTHEAYATHNLFIGLTSAPSIIVYNAESDELDVYFWENYVFEAEVESWWFGKDVSYTHLQHYPRASEIVIAQNDGDISGTLMRENDPALDDYEMYNRLIHEDEGLLDDVFGRYMPYGIRAITEYTEEELKEFK